MAPSGHTLCTPSSSSNPGGGKGVAMKRNLAARILRRVFAVNVALASFFLLTGAVFAQSPRPTSQTAHKAQTAPPAKSAQQKKATVPALFLSDIHLEPFWDPAKAPRLAAASASEWAAILTSAPSPNQQQRFAALQQSCPVRGADTSPVLFASSLKAMRAHAAGAKFAVMSGDFLSHAFQCEYHVLFPKSAPGSYRSFVEKTMDYVTGELDAILPGVPIYIALGNNDSDCGDYRLDAHGEFLRVIGKDVTRGFPAAEREGAQDSFAAGGYYSVSLPAPIENARLLVLNDIFMSSHYATCAGKADPAAADVQIAWLRQQLAAARNHKQKVWIMGHIPPGIDLYSTMRRLTDVCGGQKPMMFLSSEKLADALTDYSDVIELAIFGHTHMDEIKLLKAEMPGAYPAAPTHFIIEAKGFIAEPKVIAVKVVPSISPINRNNPSFTVAQIDPATATLTDYKVFDASNQTGVDAKWREEYDFAGSYHKTAFSSSSVSKLVAGFAADSGAKTAASQEYIRDFFAGNPSFLLSLAWQPYVCTQSHHTAQGFMPCVCPTAH
jgi:sphingomyelin phosphodiesterase acid-like 3